MPVTHEEMILLQKIFLEKITRGSCSPCNWECAFEMAINKVLNTADKAHVVNEVVAVACQFHETSLCGDILQFDFID